MELSAALVEDLTNLTEALDDSDTDLAQTVQQLAVAAQGAVGSYLGLTIFATTGGRRVTLTALEDCVKPETIRTALRLPLDAADTRMLIPDTPRASRSPPAS